MYIYIYMNININTYSKYFNLTSKKHILFWPLVDYSPLHQNSASGMKVDKIQALHICKFVYTLKGI